MLRGEQVRYLDFVAATYRAAGLWGFYRGLAPTYLKIIPATGIAFFVNDLLKNRLLH